MRPSDDAYAPDPIGFQPVDPTDPGSPAVPRPRATARWQGATVALISGAILFGACQGDNLWSGNSETTQPKVVGIAAPAQVYPGDTIQVQVSAYATRQVQRVELAISGAATVDTAVTLGSPAVSVAQTFRVALPAFLADTTLIIKAVAYDKVGAASRQKVDTAKAVAPPMIINFAGPDSVRPGSPMRIAVRAVGVRPVTRIRVQLRGAVQKYDSITVLQPRKDVSDTISFPIAANDVVDTTVIVDMQAVDNSGLGGYVARTTVPVAIAAPTVVSVTKPGSVIAGKPLDLTVVARGLRNIATINYSFRGALISDVANPVSPMARSVTQSKSFTVPANATASAVRFTITATDVAGNVSAAWTDSVPVPTGAPVVDNLIIPDSLRPGTPLDARVVAHGQRNIVSVDLRLRGATTADVTKQPLQADTAVTVDFAVPVPDVISDSLLVVSAKATDASGAVSAWVDRTLKLSDTAPPSVTMSLSAYNYAAGRPVPVRVIAKDNVGLSWVGARILSSTTQIAGDSVLTSGRSRDTTFSIMLPPSGPTTLTVVGFARDRGNREGKALATIGVVDSTAPVVNITSPADNATLPIGDPLPVTVAVTDLLGIKSISLSAVSLRTSSTADPVVVTRYQPVTVTYPQPPSLQLPLNPTVTRNMQPTADTTAEQLRIIAVVVDSTNNVGVDTVYANLGGPRVEIRSPVNGGPPATVGLPLSVRLFAIDRTAKIDSLRLDVTGAMNQTIRFPKSRMPTPADSVLIDTTITPSSTGTLTLNLAAWNGRGIIGRAITPVTIQVVPVGTGDIYAPFVQMTSIRFRNADLVDQNTRVELSDTIAVHIQATDNGSAGVKRMGITVVAIPNGTVPGVVPDTQLVKFLVARTGSQDTTFYIVPKQFGFNERVANLGPKLSVQLQFHAFAVDNQGNCGSTTQLGVNDSIPCAYGYSNAAADTFFKSSRGTPLSRTIQLVGGRTVFLPGGGNIADAVVDSLHARVYLSNIAANKIDVLKLTDTTFVATGTASGLGLVGSQPWGMSLNNAKDTLIVANSGSTNISFVVVNTARPDALKEDVGRRLMTPNEVLFEIETTLSSGILRYKVTYYDFSDRPQFVAQDMMGRLVYSTQPTGSAPDGTLRYVLPRPPLPGTTLEPKLLFNGKAIDATSDKACIAYIDSVQVINGGGSSDRVILYDHVPGSPTTLISNSVVAGGPGPVDLATAIGWLQTHGSDIFVRTGKWKVNLVGMSDTTFMAVSGDRGKIAFGEGGTTPSGRIMVWDGTKPLTEEAVSNEVAVQDLVNNASERVFGLGLNANGTLGVARGAAGAYFFTPDLRLQGLFPTPGSAGGAALHPSMTSATDQPNGLAFISTPNSSIKILDAVHFFQKGEITLRDNVVGPVKAALPLAGENAGLVAGQCNFILVKLYAVTGYTDASGNHTQVNIANVREKDINSSCTP